MALVTITEVTGSDELLLPQLREERHTGMPPFPALRRNEAHLVADLMRSHQPSYEGKFHKRDPESTNGTRQDVWLFGLAEHCGPSGLDPLPGFGG